MRRTGLREMSAVPDTTPSTRWATWSCVVVGAGGSEPVADRVGGPKGLRWSSTDRIGRGSVVDDCWDILVVADDDRGGGERGKKKENKGVAKMGSKKYSNLVHTHYIWVFQGPAQSLTLKC